MKNLIEDAEESKLEKGLYYVVKGDKWDFAFFKDKTFYKMENNIPCQLKKVDGVYRVLSYNEYKEINECGKK